MSDEARKSLIALAIVIFALLGMIGTIIFMFRYPWHHPTRTPSANQAAQQPNRAK